MYTTAHDQMNNSNTSDDLKEKVHQTQRNQNVNEVFTSETFYMYNNLGDKINDSLILSPPNSNSKPQYPTSITTQTTSCISCTYPVLPVNRTDHPLDLNIAQVDIKLIIDSALQPCNNRLYNVSGHRYDNITTSNFRDLISYNHPINDSIIHQYLTILCNFSNDMYFLDTFFFRDLCQHGWEYSHSKYFLSESTRNIYKGSKSKPPQYGVPIILIPVHINDNHWVAVTRRETHQKVSFYYSDDLNLYNMEKYIKSQLQTHCKGTNFYPDTTEWISVKTTTYLPHSNECGPRTMLALTVMGLHNHPNPNESILVPFMDAHIAQISRIWIAKTLILNNFDITPYQQHLHTQNNQLPHERTKQSVPYNLFQFLQTPTQQRTDLHPSSSHNKPLLQTEHKFDGNPHSVSAGTPSVSYTANKLQENLRLIPSPKPNIPFEPLTSATDLHLKNDDDHL
jgi:hypothetical protein